MLFDIIKRIFGARDNDYKTSQENVIYSNEPFSMVVDDVFNILGKGDVVTGKIERGAIRIGDKVKIAGGRSGKIFEVKDIEKLFKNNIKQAQAGEAVGIVLYGVNESDIQRGDTLERVY